MFFEQAEFDIRCEWGERGVAVLAPISDVVIIVDVLSFSTSVAIAVAQGARVFPYRWKDARAAEFATSVRAEFEKYSGRRARRAKIRHQDRRDPCRRALAGGLEFATRFRRSPWRRCDHERVERHALPESAQRRRSISGSQVEARRTPVAVQFR